MPLATVCLHYKLEIEIADKITEIPFLAYVWIRSSLWHKYLKSDLNFNCSRDLSSDKVQHSSTY